MPPESRRLTPAEYHLVAYVLAHAVSPKWAHLVQRALTLTGPGRGARAAAILSHLLPPEEWERLVAVYDRYAAVSETGRL